MDGGCTHIFATGDYFGGSEPWCRLDDELDEDALTTVVDFIDLETSEQTVMIEKIGGKAGKTLDALRGSPRWWTGFVEGKEFTADIDESLFSTTYYSIFMAAPEESLEELKLRYVEAASALKGLGWSEGRIAK